jgi:hypothetical protein
MKRQKPFALIAFDKMIMPIENGRGNFVHQGALLGSALLSHCLAKRPRSAHSPCFARRTNRRRTWAPRSS